MKRFAVALQYSTRTTDRASDGLDFARKSVARWRAGYIIPTHIMVTTSHRPAGSSAPAAKTNIPSKTQILSVIITCGKRYIRYFWHSDAFLSGRAHAFKKRSLHICNHMHHSIHYFVQDSGIPFLFIHGLGGDLQQSEQLLRPVEGVQKILADCPGHGKSEVADGRPLSFNDMSDQLLALMDRLSIPGFIVGGISMGAGIAVNMMVRYPERIIGAVLVRPAWLDRPLPDNLSLLLKVADYITHPDGLAAFTSLPEFQELDRTLANAAASLLGQFQRPQGAAATAALLRAMIEDAPLQDLGALNAFKKPSCIMVNQSDPLHPAGFGETLHRYLPHATLHSVFPRYVDAARHNEEVQAIISDWLIETRAWSN